MSNHSSTLMFILGLWQCLWLLAVAGPLPGASAVPWHEGSSFITFKEPDQWIFADVIRRNFYKNQLLFSRLLPPKENPTFAHQPIHRFRKPYEETFRHYHPAEEIESPYWNVGEKQHMPKTKPQEQRHHNGFMSPAYGIQIKDSDPEIEIDVVEEDEESSVELVTSTTTAAAPPSIKLRDGKSSDFSKAEVGVTGAVPQTPELATNLVLKEHNTEAVLGKSSVANISSTTSTVAPSPSSELRADALVDNTAERITSTATTSGFAIEDPSTTLRDDEAMSSSVDPHSGEAANASLAKVKDPDTLNEPIASALKDAADQAATSGFDVDDSSTTLRSNDNIALTISDDDSDDISNLTILGATTTKGNVPTMAIKTDELVSKLTEPISSETETNKENLASMAEAVASSIIPAEPEEEPSKDSQTEEDAVSEEQRPTSPVLQGERL